MPRYEPKLTEDEFHKLHEAVDSARKGTKDVKVNKEALVHILSDHSDLWKRLGED